MRFFFRLKGTHTVRSSYQHLQYRFLAVILCICLLLPYLESITQAWLPDSEGLCEHHQVHTESCGYLPETEEIPCRHSHNELCGYDAAAGASSCVHIHDESCGYRASAAAVPCAFSCPICAQDTEASETALNTSAASAVKNKYVNQWSFLGADGTPLTETYMAVTVVDLSNRDTLARRLLGALPGKIRCWGFAGWELTAAGFTETPEVQVPAYDADGTLYPNAVWGTVELDWDLTLPDTVEYGQSYTFYATPVDKGTGYGIVVNSNAAGGDNSAADPQLMSFTLTLQALDLSAHIVPSVTPPDTRVDLFDYWVATDGTMGKDLLSKTDQHQNIARTGEADWSQGINSGRLLLFGDGNIHAGYWNKGAGASSDYGKTSAGMPGIVKPLLENGYPVIDTDEMNHSVSGAEGISDHILCGDHIAWDDYTSANPKNISDTVINKWTAAQNDASLDYLFDPGTENAFKRSYPDVTGLFQIDDNGYYYYNMRRNFAEFDGDHHFILYDAPAVDRTDGLYDDASGSWSETRSIGNFLPFNTGAEVFTGVDEDGKLVNDATIQSNHTGALTANHHLGMTLTIDFRQPDNGKINMGADGMVPMSFQFSGDDDVWIFIDDVLVLDLGGIHSEIYGTIDFSTGAVSVGQSWKTNGFPYLPNGTVDVDALHANAIRDYDTTLKALFTAVGRAGSDTEWNGDTFASNTSHTLRMFYLERGNYDSSLAVRFNLQSRLYQQIKKVDQNGSPIDGVVFDLYEAGLTDADAEGAVLCTNTSNHRNLYIAQSGDSPVAELTTGVDGTARFLDLSKPIYDAFGNVTEYEPFNFADRQGVYYLLTERHAPDGYRLLPIDVALEFHRETTTLTVANRWSTGAYASAVSSIIGSGAITYGHFADESGNIEPNPDRPVSQAKQRDGLVVAIPMLRQGTTGNTWLALYGSNVDGFHTSQSGMNSAVDEAIVSAWRDAVLSAALYQAADESPNAPHWHLCWNEENRRLEGTLSDLPGMASRFRLNNENGDMRMVYGIIEPAALNALGITGRNADERYEQLGEYVRNHGVSEALAAIKAVNTQNTGSGMGFSFLNVDQFNRDFRSLIYIPNEQRELRVQKVDQDGHGLNGATFGLYRDTACTQLAASGVTANVDGQDGILVFSPRASDTDGSATIAWANSPDTEYYLKELSAPAGYEINPTVVPIIVGIYSIYADAGTPDDGITVMAGVGKLAQTMTKYASDGDVNITLRDITAVMQTQPSSRFSLTGWQDALLDGTDIPRSMNLHYGKNAVVDYGLHDEDGGKQVQPFFVTDTGFIRTRIIQNEAALTGAQYPGADNRANYDLLKTDQGELIDVTSLFSLLNVVVVTDHEEQDTQTGILSIQKQVTGSTLTTSDYTRNFPFTVRLTDTQGAELTDQYFYRGRDKSGYLRSGDTLLLHHDDWVNIQGLPEGTRFTVTEAAFDGWFMSPASGCISGSIQKGQTIEAQFLNSKDPVQPTPPPVIVPDPTPTPSPSPTPSPNPTPTPTPDRPIELPDPNNPDSPDIITIYENDVPKTYRKVWDPVDEEWEYILDEDVPLDYIPATGEAPVVAVLSAVCIVSLAGIYFLLRPSRRNPKQ